MHNGFNIDDCQLYFTILVTGEFYNGFKFVLGRVGILLAKTYFCRDSGKNRFLPVFAGFFQNLVKSFKIQNFFQLL